MINETNNQATNAPHRPPSYVIEAIRIILGINTERGVERRDHRRVARRKLRQYLADIGAATPHEIRQSIEYSDKGQQ